MSDRYKGAILSPTAPTVTPQSAGGIYTSSQQLQYQGQGVWPQAVNNPINNSLRFRSSASAYLNRTPASAGNRKTMTFSFWVKRGFMSSTQQNIISAGTGSDNYIAWSSTNDYIEMNFRNGGSASNVFLITTQVFRDPSAWYHIVLAIDTTQATASNRVKLYVNGSQVTAFSTTTYPTQNNDLNTFNNNVIQYIGQTGVGGFNFYLDGYLTEINFIDGQQLTPSSFGTTDAYGIWQPIPYTGAYGTNGFYLPFTDVATTSGSNAGLGKDFSGNGNYWTTNNISVTSGATYDSMTDVPTLTNATTANYATLNPITGSATLSNGNLAYTSSTGTYYATIGTMGVSSGKWYWEFTANGAGQVVGICGITNRGQQGVYVGSTADSYGYYGLNGQKYNNGSSSAYGATYTTNDVIGIALDMDAGTIVFYKNNASQGTAFSGLSGTFLPMASNDSTNAGAGTFNFGQRPFAYTPPSGFYPLNTYNLPTPTILDGDQYFDATLYTGTGSNQSITNSGSMQPDLVWIKVRSTTYNHNLYDSVRGVQNVLNSNATYVENISGPADLTAFNSNGFTIRQTSNYELSANGATYVAWQWRASNTTAVTNTAGTITSTVSANTTAGFSVVTYSGASTTSTVGHGLGVAPSMVIVKSRNTAGQDWQVYHTSLGQNQIIQLNATSAAQTYSNYWYNGMTSSVFGVNNYSGVNASGTNYVAYCFAQVAGYSAFGSYTGNGSTDGPFVFTGFRPRYVLIKASSTTGDWWLEDTTRNPYNAADLVLFPNTSGAESGSGVYYWDFLSNGFKLRSTSAGYNGSGTTYIYMAFAENPFKIARGR